MRANMSIDPLDHRFSGRRPVSCLLLLLLFGLCCLLSVPQAWAEDFYLSPYTGDGSDTDRFRPYCATQNGAAWVDLRPDPTKAEGHALCRSSTLPAEVGVIPLSKGLEDSLTAKSRTDVSGALKGTFSASAVPQLLKELLVDTGKVRAGKDGKLKIYLGGPVPIYQRTAWVPFEDGGLVADATNAGLAVAKAVYSATLEPAVAWATTLAFETFTNSDGNLGGRTHVHPWTQTNGGTSCQIVSNQAVCTAPSSDARADVDLATDDHEVWVTVVDLVIGPVAWVECGPIARKDATSTRTFYAFLAEQLTTGDTNHWYLSKRVAGTITQLGSTDNTDWVANDLAKIRADGSSISGFRNGVLSVGPITDTSITGNTRGGINYNAASGTGDSCTLDHWRAADIADEERSHRMPIWFP